MKKRILGLLLAGALLLTGGCAGQSAATPVPESGNATPVPTVHAVESGAPAAVPAATPAPAPEASGTPEPTAAPAPEASGTPEHTATPDPRIDWVTDLGGVYHREGDEGSLMTLFAAEGEDTYAATLALTGQPTLEGEGGYDENHIFTFTAADPAGEPLTAVVSRDGMDAILTVIHSGWTVLPVGQVILFRRNIPPIDPKAVTQLFTRYTAYDATQRGAEAAEALAVYALVRFALDQFASYRNRDQLHTAVYEGYMAMEHAAMLRYDYNLYHGIHQLATRAFADYEEVRERFAAAGVEQEMEQLTRSAEAAKNWRSLLNHLVSAGVPKLS